MKAKEFGSWASDKMSKGGFRAPNDEFNKSLKGQAYRRYKEYASSDLEEYHKYPGMKDLTVEEEEKKQNQEQSSQDQSSKSTKSSKGRQANSRLTRNLVSRVVAITAGTVVLVNTNPVLAERLPFLQISSIVEEQGENNPSASDQTDPASADLTANWTWSEDHASATLELVDGEGRVIATIPAAVSVEEEAAEICTVEGVRTYTASADEDGIAYSDTYSEPIPPAGHTFDAGKEVLLENGETAMVFECTHCHEQFTISASIEEND